MPKLTLISHFFNEEFLLPYWVSHHLPLVDQAILIDYHSTDKSCEVIHKLAPHWEVITSRNSSFIASEVDAEVMEVERNCSGWKIALNTTEFLSGEIRPELFSSVSDALWLSAKTMIDSRDLHEIECDARLIDCYPDGLSEPQWELVVASGTRRALWNRTRIGDFPGSTFRFDPRGRRRLVHSAPDGKYWVGRHGSHLAAQPSKHVVHWFALAPWTPEFVARKLQISTVIPRSEIDQGFGGQHFLDFEELERTRKFLVPFLTR